jgi:hypothetical protein
MTTKKKDPRGRKPLDPKEKKVRVYAGYKKPADVHKLGGNKKVASFLSNHFDERLNLMEK